MALTEIPIELSSTPSIVDGGNATAITIDSSENVSFATSGGLIKSIGGDVALVQGAVGVRINDSGSAISPTTASANSDGAVDLGVSNIRFKDLYLSGGAYLGGTAAANKLDSYEEGTWTMGITTSGSPNITITNTTGHYTRVGDLVTVGIYTAGINVVNAGSGTVNITGLPFNIRSAGGNSDYTAASFAHTDLFSSTYAAYPAIGNAFARVTQVGSIANAVIATGNPRYLMFSLTYFAA
jgi:hypothetical protein